MCRGRKKVNSWDFSIVEKRRKEAEQFCLYNIQGLNTIKGPVTVYRKVKGNDPRLLRKVRKWGENEDSKPYQAKLIESRRTGPHDKCVALQI